MPIEVELDVSELSGLGQSLFSSLKMCRIKTEKNSSESGTSSVRLLDLGV